MTIERIGQIRGGVILALSAAVLGACSPSGTAAVAPPARTAQGFAVVQTSSVHQFEGATYTRTAGGIQVTSNGHTLAFPASASVQPASLSPTAKVRAARDTCEDQALGKQRGVREDCAGTSSVSGNMVSFTCDGGGGLIATGSIPSGASSITIDITGVDANGSPESGSWTFYGNAGQQFSYNMSGPNPYTSGSGTVSTGNTVVGTGTWTGP